VDQVADRILDVAFRLCGNNDDLRANVRTAIEGLVKDNILFLSGETRWQGELRAHLLGGEHDVCALAQQVWEEVGYGDGKRLTVLNHIRSQSPEISNQVDPGGAGDQGIMVGYATDETDVMMPREWLLARDICLALRDLHVSGKLPYLRPDCKSQVTLDPDDRVLSVIVAAQHAEHVDLVQLRDEVFTHAVLPIVGEVARERVKINAKGRFCIGGPMGDAGALGRKLAIDAYGPRVPVGGGAYSGKDPTKVDRSAAYMARHISKTVVREYHGVHECTVKIAYAIGHERPEMITAITDTGEDVSDWVQQRFPDLSPGHIIGYLGLWKPVGWSYFETAAYGHYGRPQFPWERRPEELR
jgi:S-adenosylmethionine synthetase